MNRTEPDNQVSVSEPAAPDPYAPDSQVRTGNTDTDERTATELQGNINLDDRSAALHDPTGTSPPSPDSGEPGNSSPLTQGHHYHLRSRGEPPERYMDTSEQNMLKRRNDSSCERNKRPRVQYDSDCVATANSQNGNPRQPFPMNHVQRNVSSNWLKVCCFVISALDLMFPGTI